MADSRTSAVQAVAAGALLGAVGGHTHQAEVALRRGGGFDRHATLGLARRARLRRSAAGDGLRWHE